MPLALTVPVPTFTTLTAKVTEAVPPRAALRVMGAAGDTKATLMGEGMAVMVRARVAAAESSPAAFFATTLTAPVPLVR